MKINTPVIAGLDIGTTKVSLAVATIKEDQSLQIVGIGTAPNVGVKQGIVVNIDATTEAIRRAREEAELMSGYRVEAVWVGVSGSHIKSFDSKGMVAIKNKDGVTKQDVERVIEAAKAVVVPAERTVLHVIPRDYKVDGQDGILDPIGMSGVRLEASVHIVTGSQMAISNNLKCIERAGLQVKGLVLDQLASSIAVLSEDEKSLGVCVVDIGGGTCNSIYYINGSAAHTSLIPVGGSHFTHDIAVGLRTPQAAAEELKKKFGCAMAGLIEAQEAIEVEGVGGRKSRTVLRKDLAEVIEPRAEEVLQMIHQDIQRSGLLPMLGSGVVLTGGGSQLDGMIEMGEFVLDLPVRRGLPVGIGGINEIVKSASHAAAVGLLMYGYKEFKQQQLNLVQDADNSSISGVAKKFKNILDDLF